MKTEFGKLNFLCSFSQLLMSNITCSLFTVLFTADFGFLAAFWPGICVDIITTTPPPYVFALTHNSVFNTSDSYSKSVRA